MSTFRLTTAPALEPVTVSEALVHCRARPGVDNAYLSGLIERARRYAEKVLDRQLITATWELVLDRFPPEIAIRKPPVQSITSIKYYDTGGVQRTLAASEYQVDLADLDAPARIQPAYGRTWPSTRSELYEVVTVRFIAGYGLTPETVPAEIRHLLLLLLAHWHEHREPTSERALAPNPLAVESLLAAAGWGRYGGD